MKDHTLYIIRRTLLALCLLLGASGAWADEVRTEAELRTVLGTSSTNITLMADIELTNTVEFTSTLSIELNLNGHSIIGNNCRALWIKNGNVTIKSTGDEGTVTSNGIARNSSVIRVGDNSGESRNIGLTIDKNVVVSAQPCYGITVFGSQTTETVVINGKVTTHDYPAIGGNGSAGYEGTNITISEGAEVSSVDEIAIYQPQNGTLTVNGKVSGKGGIELKAGSLVVGATARITATGTPSHPSASTSGSSTLGYAVAIVENGAYSGVTTVNVSPSAVLTGPIAMVKDSENTTTQNVTFPDGGIKMLVKVTDSESKPFGQYRSFELAMQEAPAGSTITLLGDCSMAETVETTKNFTLDLDGHTLTSDGQQALWIKSGTVTVTSTAGGGKITVPTISDHDASAIRVGSDETAAVSLTVGENVTISADECYGITIFGNNDTESLTVYGDVETKIRPAIAGNGASGLKSTTISIGADADITTTNEVAIYHPQAGTITVNGSEGHLATVTGAGGIEMKGGTLSVGQYATVRATGTPMHTANDAGTSSRGYSVAVVDNNTNGNVVTEVTIHNSASLTGPVAELQDSHKDGFNPTYDGNAVATKVAAIGNDKYFVLKDAVDIVPSEGTVTLLGNLSLGSTLIMDKEKTYTLNQNGHTLTGHNCAAIKIEGGHITLDGGTNSKVTVDGDWSDVSDAAAILMGDDTGESRNVSLTVNSNVTVDGSTLASGIQLSGSITRESLIVKGTVAADGHSAIIGSKDAAKGGTSIEVASGGKVQATNAVVIYHPQSGELRVEGNGQVIGSVIGSDTAAGAIEMKGGNLTIESDATITAKGSTSHSANADAPSTNGYAIALVENADFTGVGRVNIDEQARITGVIACLIDSKNNSVAEPLFTGDITMVAETNISEGRGDKYATLPYAIAAATAGSEVKLLDDLTVTSTFNINKAITLNMDDYSLINSHNSDPAVNVEVAADANVTIKNGGIVSEKTGTPATDKANGGIKVTSGTVALQQMDVKTGGVSLNVLSGTVTADQYSSFSATKDNTVVLAGGTLTIGGRVLNSSTGANKDAIAATAGTATIASTSVISSASGNGIDWQSDGTLTINGGKIMGAEAVNANSGTVTINGGTFTGTGNSVNLGSSTPAVNGGTFICGESYMPIVATSATGFVKGDYFSKPIAQALCASGYMMSTNPKNNGMYYLIDEIVITDGADWTKPTESFTIKKAKYIRNSGMGANGTKFGTLCLPFSFSSTQTGMTFYAVNRIAGDVLYLDAVNTSTTPTIDAGTPVVFQFASAQTGFTIESDMADISHEDAREANNLVGTFGKTVLTTETIPRVDNVYYLNSDAFHQANTSLTVPAFRAYIKFSPSPLPRPRVLYIHTDDMMDAIEAINEESDVESVYDMNGIRQNGLKAGLNIVRMANGRTIKVMVR